MIENNVKKFGFSILSVYITLLITAVFAIFLPSNEVIDTLKNSLAVFLGLVAFPLFLLKKGIVNLSRNHEFKLGIQELFLLLSSALVVAFKYNTGGVYILSILVIAFSEEFLYRYFLIDENTRVNLIISSIIFAFVVHLNEPFLSNLFIRLPLGLFFGFVYSKKRSLLWCTCLHFMYNLLMS